MNISVSCGHCGEQFVVVEKWAGVWIKCPACQQAIQVPGQTPASPQPHDILDGSVPPATTTGPNARHPSPGEAPPSARPADPRPTLQASSPPQPTAAPAQPAASDSSLLDNELLACLNDDGAEEELLPPTRRGFRRRARRLTVTPLHLDVDLRYIAWRWGRFLFAFTFTIVMAVVHAMVTSDMAAYAMVVLGIPTCLLALAPPTEWWDGCLRTVICGTILAVQGTPIFFALFVLCMNGAPFWFTLLFIIVGMIYLAAHVLIPYAIYRAVGTVNTHIFVLLVGSIFIFGIQDETFFEAIQKQQEEFREAILDMAGENE